VYGFLPACSAYLLSPIGLLAFTWDMVSLFLVIFSYSYYGLVAGFDLILAFFFMSKKKGMQPSLRRLWNLSNPMS